MGYIYIHTNKANGKKYIGQTIQEPEQRWGNDGHGYKGQPFYNAIQKYGWEGFEHQVFELSEGELDYAERYLVLWYNTTNPEKGYNCESGGNKGKHHSEESKAKMSESMKGRYVGEKSPFYGKHLSEETKRKNSEAHKGEKHPMWGKHHSERTRQKMSESQKGKTRSEEICQKLSETHKGKHHSEETKQKMSESRKGHSVSDETKRKLSGVNRGKHLSEETLQKMSETMKVKMNSLETKEKLKATKQLQSQEYQLYKQNGGGLKWNEWCKQRSSNH